MTPVLKAMVEAMAAEFERQADEETPGAFARPHAHYSGYRIVGGWDLEKVARAGLEAIREPTDFDDVMSAGGKAEPFQMSEGERFTPGRIIAGTCFRAMIDAILKPDTTP